MKNNTNTTHIYEYKYVKIVWIKKNTCQNLYNILNMRWHKKYEYNMNKQIIRFTELCYYMFIVYCLMFNVLSLNIQKNFNKKKEAILLS